MYIAACYVRINGMMYTRGDSIPDGLPNSKIEWLLKAEAIKESPSAFSDTAIRAEEAPVPETAEINVMEGVVQSAEIEHATQRKAAKGGKTK